MPVVLISINHRTAPVALRARFALSETEVAEALPRLRALPGVDECLVLSTCNRTEVYAHASHDLSTDTLQRVLCDLKGLSTATLRGASVALHDASAVRHGFRVAAGLDSMVTGEAQILGQVRDAYRTARDLDTAGPVLNRLMQLAVAAGRRVRRETALGGRSVSAAHAALSACREALGSIAQRRILVVGAGEMAALVVKVFAGAQARIAAIANRSLDAARLLVGRTGARAIPLDEMPRVLAEVDAIVVAVGGGDPVLRRHHLAPASGHILPLVIVDLGVPRGVDADVAALPGIVVYDLDALSGILPPVPPDALADAERLAHDAADRFMRWYNSRAVGPVIAALRRRADEIAEQTYTRLQPRLQPLDARSQALVRAAMHTALHRLLHGPTVRLKEAATDPQVLELAHDLFGFDGKAEGEQR